MRELDQDELIDRWTLVGEELGLVATKRGAAKLGFAVMLRFYSERGRFPRGRSEIPDNVVEYVARQVGIERTEIAFYDFAGRTSKAHRAQIREALGFRECSVADADVVTAWLVENVAQVERSGDRVREHALARCRAEMPGVASARSSVPSDSADEPATMRHCASVQCSSTIRSGSVA